MNKQRRNGRPVHSGFIIIRLAENLATATRNFEDLLTIATTLSIPPLQEILEKYGLTLTRRVVRSATPGQIAEFENEAKQTNFPPLHNLATYWRVDARDQANHIDQIVEQLNALPQVDVAYRELEVSDPTGNPNPILNPYSVRQGYLEPAPIGIDARWAWTQPNGKGAGIRFVDLEQGWFEGHEDFAIKAPSLIYGDNRNNQGSYKGDHGSAVLGEVVAADNAVGVMGIAPSVTSVGLASHYDAITNTALHVADAIMAILKNRKLHAGDVLLLEVQRSYLPTEIDDADFDAIRLCTAHGIIVVEAAGNGDRDLDKYQSSSKYVLKPNSPDFRESGAIMVGAASSSEPHNRLSFSNFGSRINCYAWGENVVTCGYGDLNGYTQDDVSYTATFNGTSAAAPIIAGAALVVQGMHEPKNHRRLSPLEMRDLLSSPKTGTPQGTKVKGAIGVMPDLRAIIKDQRLVEPKGSLRK